MMMSTLVQAHIQFGKIWYDSKKPFNLSRFESDLLKNQTNLFFFLNQINLIQSDLSNPNSNSTQH
jgi:hypothetical protein